MHSKLILNNNIKRFTLSAIFGLCCLFNVPSPSLKADGWGPTGRVTEHEKVSWDRIHCELDDMKLKAWIPNYSGSNFQDNTISLNGQVDEDKGYVIQTSYSRNFAPPKSQKKFVKLIQDANKSYDVKAVDGKNFGAKYVVDLIPAQKDVTAYWRFISTKDRLIQLGTDDTNKKCRQHFFDSISIEYPKK